MQNRGAEKKAKGREKKETEAKVKTLIQCLDAKKELIDAVNEAEKKGENFKN